MTAFDHALRRSEKILVSNGASKHACRFTVGSKDWNGQWPANFRTRSRQAQTRPQSTRFPGLDFLIPYNSS